LFTSRYCRGERPCQLNEHRRFRTWRPRTTAALRAPGPTSRRTSRS